MVLAASQLVLCNAQCGVSVIASFDVIIIIIIIIVISSSSRHKRRVRDDTERACSE